MSGNTKPVEIRHSRDQAIAIGDREHERSPVEAFDHLGIFKLLANGGVRIGGEDSPAVMAGNGNLPGHPDWDGYPASYRLTRHDNGDSQFDMHFDEPDPSGQFNRTYLFDASHGSWLRIDFVDIDPSHVRMREASRIRIEDCQIDRREVSFDSDGNAQLETGVSIGRSLAVTVTDTETGECQVLHQGRVRQRHRLINIRNDGGCTQIDIISIPEIHTARSFLADGNKCCEFIRYVEEEVPRKGLTSLVRLGKKVKKRFLRFPIRWEPWPSYSHDGPGVDRGERARNLVPSVQQVRPYLSALCRNDPYRREGVPSFQLAQCPVPEKLLTESLLVVGKPGSGKSILLKMLLLWAFLFRRDPDFLAFVSNPKGDYQALFDHELPNVRYVDANVFNAQGHAFRIDTLLTSAAAVNDFVSLMVPLEEKQDPFWPKNARVALKIVVNYFRSTGTRFNLRDLYQATVNDDALLAICEKTQAGRQFLAKHSKAEKQFSGVVANLALVLDDLEIIANASNHHEQCGREFCMVEVMRRETSIRAILVGDSTEAEASLKHYNRLLFWAFARLARSPKHCPEVHHVRNAFIVDELYDYADMELLGPYVQKGRSLGACVLGATQSLEKLNEMSRRKPGAICWPELVETVIYLRCTGPDAKAASEFIGKAYRRAVSWNASTNQSTSHGDSGGRSVQWNASSGSQGPSSSLGGGWQEGWSRSDSYGSSNGMQINLELRDVVMPSDLCCDLPKPNAIDGLVGFVVTNPHLAGGLWRFSIGMSSWPSSPDNQVEELDVRHQESVPWTDSELRAFGLDELLEPRSESSPLPITHVETLQLLSEAESIDEAELAADLDDVFIPGERNG